MISRFRRYASRNGTSAALRKAASEARRRVYSRDRVTLLLKDLDSIVTPRRPAAIVVEPLEPRHLDGLSDLNRRRGRPTVDRRFRNYLDNGLGGFVGLREGEVIGYYWWVDCAARADHPDLDWLGNFIRSQPGDVYGSDFYILPDERGGGVAGEFLYRVESSLAERGFARLWGYVEAGNREARWVYSSRGYLPMGDLTLRRSLSRIKATAIPQLESNVS